MGAAPAVVADDEPRAVSGGPPSGIAQTTLVQARNALADGLIRYRAAIANLQTLTGAF